jgi:hypothetical protein
MPYKLVRRPLFSFITLLITVLLVSAKLPPPSLFTLSRVDLGIHR